MGDTADAREIPSTIGSHFLTDALTQIILAWRLYKVEAYINPPAFPGEISQFAATELIGFLHWLDKKLAEEESVGGNQATLPWINRG